MEKNKKAVDMYGKDLKNDINYFDIFNSNFIELDFTKEQQRDFTIRKEILWKSDSPTDKQVNNKEVEFINSYKSNNSDIIN